MTKTTWAGRSASPPTPEDENPRAGWIPVAGVIAALGLVGAGGYVLGSSDATTDTATAPTTTTAGVVTTATEDDAGNPTTDEPVEEETPLTDPSEDSATEAAEGGAAENGAAGGNAEDDTASDETTTDDGTANQVVLEEGQVRGALLRNGVLYLGGAVPSEAIGDEIIERAEAVVGEGNVVSEYVIDPEAEMAEGAPLYIDDVILFAYGANTYDPQFEPLLDLGLALLSQNPSVTVTIITHTDSSGSASFNDRLSYQRGQSVAQYWVDRGIPVEQIVIDARGERDPRVDDQTEEGAQLNRRAEFYIEGLLP